MRGKKRAEEEVRVSQQATTIGIVTHCARFAVGPAQLLAVRQGAPHVRQKFARWARYFESRVRSRVCGGGGFFSAGQQVDRNGEGNGEREKQRGGAMRGPE
jgi:hypothetical protein